MLISLLRPACRKKFNEALNKLVDTMAVDAELAIASKADFILEAIWRVIFAFMTISGGINFFELSEKIL